MKKFMIALLGAILMMSSCVKDNTARDIVGDWHMQDEEIQVWVSFTAEGTFSLYQKLMEGRYVHYDGVYMLSSGILSGEYSDGTAWADSYKVTIENSLMILSTTSESYTYFRESLPSFDL